VERNPIIRYFPGQAGVGEPNRRRYPGMIRLMREQGLPTPELQIMDNQFQVVLRRPRGVQGLL